MCPKQQWDHALEIHRTDIVVAYGCLKVRWQWRTGHVLVRVFFIFFQSTGLMMNIVKDSTHRIALGGGHRVAPVLHHDLTPSPLTCLHSQSTIVGNVAGVRPICPPGNRRTHLGEPVSVKSAMSCTGHCLSSLPFTSNKGAQGWSSIPCSSKDKRLKPSMYSVSLVA